MQADIMIQILSIVLTALGIVALLLILGYSIYGEEATQD